MLNFIKNIQSRAKARKTLYDSIELTHDAILSAHRTEGIDEEETRALIREFESQMLRYIKDTSRLTLVEKWWYAKDLRNKSDHVIDMALIVSKLIWITTLHRNKAHESQI